VIVALLLVAFVIVWNRWVLAPGRQRLYLLPALLVALAIPFVIPVEWVYVRGMTAVASVVMAGKTYELSRGRVPDPSMLERWPSFCFWLLVPLRSRQSQSPAEADRVRAEGRRRLLRALPKLPGVAVLVLLHIHWPGLHDNLWVEGFWGLWLTYLSLSAVVDVVGGLAMQSGNHLSEGFDSPPLARSPRDFWGRRWNLVVHDMLLRHVFMPMGGLRHPLRSTLAVFIVSGLIHEYFVIACLGRGSSHAGWMMMFFTVHGLAVVAQLAWDRGPGRRSKMPRPLAIALHLCWLTLTIPIFFAPLGEIFVDAWPN